MPGLLRIADRNSMHFSIESRMPFLTTDLAELALTLPENFLTYKNGYTKSILRDAMIDIVPEKILFRKDKIGLQTSQKNWIQENSSEFKNLIYEWAKHDDFIDQKNNEILR